MKLFREHTESFTRLFEALNLLPSNSDDKKAKTKQIISYLEVIEAQTKRLSKRRKLVLVDCAAGNCYLSFLVYHFYATVVGRPVELHCIDHNAALMSKAGGLAADLGFGDMHFHTGDILSLRLGKQIDVLYTLHACDDATDKALYVGLKHSARLILSVTCCQHTLAKQFQNRALKGVTRYKSIKTRLVYSIAETMRAHLVAMQGYEVEVFDFTSSRNTDKNVMLRAKRNNQVMKEQLQAEYAFLRESFGLRPALESLLFV